jgi:hypothetical protein
LLVVSFDLLFDVCKGFLTTFFLNFESNSSFDSLTHISFIASYKSQISLNVLLVPSSEKSLFNSRIKSSYLFLSFSCNLIISSLSSVHLYLLSSYCSFNCFMSYNLCSSWTSKARFKSSFLFLNSLHSRSADYNFFF